LEGSCRHCFGPVFLTLAADVAHGMAADSVAVVLGALVEEVAAASPEAADPLAVVVLAEIGKLR